MPELWPHQVEALKRMRDREHFALLMAMRTGKSKTTLVDFAYLYGKGKVDSMLVIAPAGVYRTWVTAIDEHMRMFADVHVWESGPRAKERAEAFMKQDRRPQVLLVNVEALSLKTSPARATCEAFLKSRQCYVVIDESTIIKNHSAKRTKYVNKVLRPLSKYRRILTGLVSPRDLLDLYSQFEFLDKEILQCKDFFQFRFRWAIMREMQAGGRKFMMVVGFKKGAAEALQKLIEPHSFRVPFRPKVPSTYSIREVAMTPEQAKAYTELKQYATTKIGESSHVTASIVIAQLTRMHQVLCGHVRDEEGVEHELPENRTAALMEELADYSGKAIIWFTYVPNLEKCARVIADEYGPESVAQFYGGNASTREADELRFKAQDSCRFMLATAGAGGRGRTWSVADRVINFSTANNLEHREQSEQRSMGVEKDRGVDNVDLIVPNTVEMKILEALRGKIDMASVINGDTWREWLI